MVGGHGSCREQAVPARLITEHPLSQPFLSFLLRAMPQHNLTVSNSVTKITRRSPFLRGEEGKGGASSVSAARAPQRLSGTGRVRQRRGAHGAISSVLGCGWEAALPAQIPADTPWGAGKALFFFLLTLDELPQKQPRLGLIISASSDGSRRAPTSSSLKV